MVPSLSPHSLHLLFCCVPIYSLFDINIIIIVAIRFFFCTLSSLGIFNFSIFLYQPKNYLDRNIYTDCRIVWAGSQWVQAVYNLMNYIDRLTSWSQEKISQSTTIRTNMRRCKSSSFNFSYCSLLQSRRFFCNMNLTTG